MYYSTLTFFLVLFVTIDGRRLSESKRQQSQNNANTNNERYIKDTWNVYFRGQKVAGASASSFTDLGYGYGKDTWGVYYYGKKIDGATVSSFQILQPYGGYAKDTWNVYFLENKVQGASSSSFQSLGNGYGKDTWYTYYQGKKIN